MVSPTKVASSGSVVARLPSSRTIPGVESGPQTGNAAAADAALRTRTIAAYRSLLATVGLTPEQDSSIRTHLIDAEDNWAAGLAAWNSDRDEALQALADGKRNESDLAARLDDNGDALFDRLARDTQAALVNELGAAHRVRIRDFLRENLHAIVETRPFEGREPPP